MPFFGTVGKRVKRHTALSTYPVTSRNRSLNSCGLFDDSNGREALPFRTHSRLADLLLLKNPVANAFHTGLPIVLRHEKYWLQSVLRNAINARLSCGARLSPYSWPLIARVFANCPLNPVGT